MLALTHVTFLPAVSFCVENVKTVDGAVGKIEGVKVYRALSS